MRTTALKERTGMKREPRRIRESRRLADQGIEDAEDTQAIADSILSRSNERVRELNLDPGSLPEHPLRREADLRRTKQWEFYGPVLKILLNAPGEKMKASEVIEHVGDMMRERLSIADMERLNNGEERWRSTCRFARLDMTEAGYLDKNAPRGIWKLS